MRVCGACGQPGHNRRTCTAASAASKPAKVRAKKKKKQKKIKCSRCKEEDHLAKNCPYKPLPKGTKIGPKLMKCGHFSWWKDGDKCTFCNKSYGRVGWQNEFS